MKSIFFSMLLVTFFMKTSFCPGPVLDGYGRVGWKISWVGISLVILSSHSLEDVYYMYTEKSFHGQPRLEYHAFSQQNKLYFY